jgi:hypothetical protein
MKIYSNYVTALFGTLFFGWTSAAFAQDDPNAAINLQTARLNAEAAKINAEAALAKARADKDRAAIESLGLPKFDNKTTIGEGGGAIETSMLATTAVQAAAIKIKDNLPNVATCRPGSYVILPAGQNFNPNLDKTVIAQIEYLTAQFEQYDQSRPGAVGVETGIAVISALAGLAGNEVTVTGVALNEIDNAMLANAVAGALRNCAYMPGSGVPTLDHTRSKLAKALSALSTARRNANAWVKTLDKKGKKTNAQNIAAIDDLTKELSALEKSLMAVNEQGVSLFERAMVIEKVRESATHVVNIKVNKAGGTITNSKNIATFFGEDPVKVSGGLTASWSVMQLSDGLNASSGTVSCQTAQAKLKQVQSGQWVNAKSEKQQAVCQS